MGWSSKLQFLASNTRFLGWIYIYTVIAKTSTDQKVVSGVKQVLPYQWKHVLLSSAKFIDKAWEPVKSCSQVFPAAEHFLSDAGNHPVSLSGLTETLSEPKIQSFPVLLSISRNFAAKSLQPCSTSKSPELRQRTGNQHCFILHLLICWVPSGKLTVRP